MQAVFERMCKFVKHYVVDMLSKLLRGSLKKTKKLLRGNSFVSTIKPLSCLLFTTLYMLNC